MSCPPGMAFLSEGGSSLGEETPSASSRNEVDDKEDKEEKANSKTSLSSERTASRKDNSGKSQPVDLTQVLFSFYIKFILCNGFYVLPCEVKWSLKPRTSTTIPKMMRSIFNFYKHILGDAVVV